MWSPQVVLRTQQSVTGHWWNVSVCVCVRNCAYMCVSIHRRKWEEDTGITIIHMTIVYYTSDFACDN